MTGSSSSSHYSRTEPGRKPPDGASAIGAARIHTMLDRAYVGFPERLAGKKGETRMAKIDVSGTGFKQLIIAVQSLPEHERDQVLAEIRETRSVEDYSVVAAVIELVKSGAAGFVGGIDA